MNNTDRYIFEIREILLQQTLKNRQKSSINPLNMYEKKVFSQTGEDGIILEIIKRIGLKFGNFLEISPGDGLENNTLILAAQGWSGLWIGEEKINLDLSKSSIKFRNLRVNLNNLSELDKDLDYLPYDLVSIDIDSFDYYLIEYILNYGIRPSVFIFEYNANFPPPLEFIKSHDSANLSWTGDFNYGSSLQSLNNLLEKFNYKLVACGVSGVNAFFVKKEFEDKFNDVPKEILDIYQEPFYFVSLKNGHAVSIDAINNLIKKG